MGKLVISRKKSLGDSLRAYKIFLNEKKIGEIKHDEDFTFSCPLGKHKLSLRIDWCSTSKEFEVTQDNEDVFFHCEPNISGWKLPFAFLFMPGKWIRLERKLEFSK